MLLLPDPRNKGAVPILASIPGAKVNLPLTCNPPTGIQAGQGANAILPGIVVQTNVVIPGRTSVLCPSCRTMCEVPANSRGQVFSCGACQKPFSSP